ncbi:MAG: nuclear transport factor 2 family protein [Dehalococcoidia bacterium]|nr:nuclear transport factor 2 family protein [Dehalococcoidia bacterium]
MEKTPTEIIQDFCAAWVRLDADEIMGYFGPEPVYHNMPGPPVKGREAVRSTIASFLKGWQQTVWEVTNIAADGNVVFAERIDRTDAGGRHVDLPVVGVFEIHDGKIDAWRDYFDLATYTRAMTGS